MTFRAKIMGNLPVNKWKLTVPVILKLKIGAQVVFLKNNKPHWMNGDIGTVEGFNDETVLVKKKHSKNVVSVEKEVWVKYKYYYNYETKRIEKEPVASFHQYPLNLGWAVTIHRSQGMTLEDYTIDLVNGAFEAGQVYVALSRAKSFYSVSLVVPIQTKDIKVNHLVTEFYQGLGD